MQGPLTVLSYTTRLSFTQFNRISTIACPKMKKMAQALESQSLSHAGPPVFQYAFEGDPHTSATKDNDTVGFELKVCYQVDAVAMVDVVFDPSDDLRLETLTAFECISLHTNNFTWSQARDLAEKKGRTRNLIEREIYHHWAGPGNVRTRLELQVGVR
jgi:hypothetical protein